MWNLPHDNGDWEVHSPDSGSSSHDLDQKGVRKGVIPSSPPTNQPDEGHS